MTADVRSAGRRHLAMVGFTIASVALVTWALPYFDGVPLIRERPLMVYFVACVVASTLGGRVAWLTAVSSSTLAFYVYLLEPRGTLVFKENVGDLTAIAGFLGVSIFVAYLSEVSGRAKARALVAQEALRAAEERVLGLETVRRSEERLRAAFEALMDPVEILEAVRDENHRIIDYRYAYVNRALEQLLGRSADELVGARMRELYPTVAREFTDCLDHVVETGEPLVQQAVVRGSVVYGSIRWFDTRGGRLGDGLVFTFRDVTDQRVAAEQLAASERVYRLLSENTNDVVFVAREGSIRWTSPSAEAVLGWRPDELIGRPCSDIVAPQDLPAVAEVQPRVAAGERVRLRLRYVVRDRSVHWADVVFGPLLDEDGNVEGVLVCGSNVDAEVAAEAEVQEVHRQRDRLIEQLPVGVFQARVLESGQAVFSFVSQRTANLLRLPAGEWLNSGAMKRRLADLDWHRLWAAGETALSTGGDLRWEGPLVDEDPPVWLRIRATAERMGQGLVFDGIVVDITQEKAYQIALVREAEFAAQRANDLAEIDRTKSALLAALGHDLRTPLAVIAAAAASLRHSSGLSGEQRGELLCNIEESGEALGHLLTNLLDLSRVQAGSLPVELGPVHVVDVLEDPLRRGGDDIQLDLPEDLPCVVADPGLLERVLDNLVRNAQHYRPPGTAVTVAAEPAGDRVQLRVIDQGPGVPEERYDEMFQPFQRLDDRSQEGLGLGLSIARAFTEAMGGALTPSATPGGGLTMTLEPGFRVIGLG